MSALPAELVQDFSVPPQRTPSAESNFRELDDAFLQTQAIIWLGEVLKIKFNEQISISNLLADGKLLFEVSEAIMKMLPSLSMDDTQLKVYEWKSLTSNKSTRRYMPYYNVDSFLRMCKNLGMDGIDLFTPSDVVEQRNTRKVCMCLRSLSKKAKLKDINVPDFDSVTCTLSMPTDKVEYIRKSLEMSQSSSSVSIEQDAEKASRVRFWRRMSNSASTLIDQISEDCDEVESRFVVDESYESSDCAYGAESLNILGPQVVKNEDDDQCEYLSPSKAESVGSPCSQYYSDEDLSMSSSDCHGSRISGKGPELDSEISFGYRNGDLNHVPLNWGDIHLGVGPSIDGNRKVDEYDYVSHDKEDTDTACSHCHPIGYHTCNEYHGTTKDPSAVDFDKNLESAEPHECAIKGDLHAGETQKLSYEETLVCEVGVRNGKLQPELKFNEKDLLCELTEQSFNASKSLENPCSLDKCEYHAFKACTEVVNVKREHCSDGLFDGNVSVEDANDQLEYHDEKALYSIDCDIQNRIHSSLIFVKSNGSDESNDHWDHVKNVDHSRESIPLLLEVDTIICGDNFNSQINDGKEAFGENMITRDHLKQCCDKGLTDGTFINYTDIPHEDLNSSPCVTLAKCNTICLNDSDASMKESNDHNALFESVGDKPLNIDNIIHVDTSATSSCDLQHEAQSLKNDDDTSHVNHENVEEVDKGQSGVPKEEGPDKELPLTKPPRKLLKSVVKGTALVGLAVFLLHLRNNRRESHSKGKKQSSRLVKHGTPKPLQNSGSISSVYPAEKLHLGI